MSAAIAGLEDVLWPGASVLLGSGNHFDDPGADPGAGGVAGFRCTESYVAIPSLERPRYLMPAGLEPRAAARLLWDYNALRASPARAARAALAAMVRLGYLPGRRTQCLVVTHDSPAGSLLHTIAEHVGRPAGELAFSGGVRVRTRTARPVLCVVDTAGRPVMFVKIARTPLHRRRLMAAHDMLERVGALQVPGLHTPRPMLLIERAGSLILGTSPLPADVRPLRPRPRDEALAGRMLEVLVRGGATTECTVQDSPWVAGLRERIGCLPAQTRTAAARVADLVMRRWADLPLEHGIGHGDWSFWNLATSRSVHALAAWDWEFGHPCMPLAIDRLHGAFATASTVRRRPLAEILRAETIRAGADPVGRAEMELHLLEMVLRRLEDADQGDRRGLATAYGLMRALAPRA